MTVLASWMGPMKVGQMMKYTLPGKGMESVQDPVKGITGDKEVPCKKRELHK